MEKEFAVDGGLALEQLESTIRFEEIKGYELYEIKPISSGRNKVTLAKRSFGNYPKELKITASTEEVKYFERILNSPVWIIAEGKMVEVAIWREK